MARRIKVRRRTSAVGEIEQMVQDDWKSIFKLYKEELERACIIIEEDARMIVPLDTGTLLESINVRMSRSNRWLGMMASASAKNANTGYDYAQIQEANEDYNHPNGGQAHYLSEPMFRELDRIYYKHTGKHLEPPEDWTW